MSILNIRLSLQEETIKIFIDEVHLPNEKPKFPADLKQYSSGNIQDYSYRLKAYSILHNMINSSKQSGLDASSQAEKSSMLFWAQTNDSKKLYQQTSSVIELPKTPHLALLWLAYMSSIFNNTRCQTEFLDSSIERAPGTKEDEYPSLSQSIGEYFSHDVKKGQRLKTLIKKILSLSSQSAAYEATRDAIEIMSNRYNDSGKPFIENLSTKHQDELLFDKIGTKTLDVNISLAHRTNDLLGFAQRGLRKGQKIELNYIINHINCMAKERIYNKCLGKKAHDGGKYNHSYTEWDFLRAADFTLLKDGRLSINLSTNASYLKYYAPGQENAAIFKDEMIFLAKVADLKFDADSNFEKELIFTPACSMELKNQGLHLNLAYMKKLLRQKNYFSLFRQAYEFHEKEHENNFFSNVPVEIGEQIFYAINPEIDNKDIKESCNQAWTNRL